MPRGHPKRTHEVVDLTGADDTEPTQNKRQATSSTGIGSTSMYRSQQPQSSNALPASQVTAEPEYLDLTQEEEGSGTELYGTFGPLNRYPIHQMIE